MRVTNREGQPDPTPPLLADGGAILATISALFVSDRPEAVTNVAVCVGFQYQADRGRLEGLLELRATRCSGQMLDQLW